MPIRKIDQRGVHHYFPEFESMSRQQIVDYQWKRLKHQLKYLWESNPFFRRRFEDHGVTPDDIKTPEDFRKKIPLMEKKDLISDQKEHPPYGERVGVELKRVVMTHITSGTSGLGQEVYGCTQADVDQIGGMWALHYDWAGLRRGDPLLHCFPIATMTAGLGSMVGAMQMGLRCYLSAFFDTKTKLEYMKRFDPKGLLAVPAYLTTMTETAKELGYNFRRDFPSLETIVIAAGSYPKSWAKEMEETWNAALSEQYGSTQSGTGFVITCENGVLNSKGDHHLMHIAEWFVYAEVLDRETREPVKPGEAGELIVTPLQREASPLLRFATSDKVILRNYDECSCGRPFMGITNGTIERYDDMIKMKGMNVWPAAIDSVVLAEKEVFDYKGRVFMNTKGKETCLMSIEFKKGVPDSKKQELMKQIVFKVQEKVGIRMDIEECPPEGLQRIQFKGKRWIDERIKGLERKAF